MSDGFFKSLNGNLPAIAGDDFFKLPAFTAKLPGRLENAGMLDRAGWRPPQVSGAARPLDKQVVGFRPAAGKNDFALVRIDETRDALPCLIKRMACCSTVFVPA